MTISALESSRHGAIGFALQSAIGSAAANPTYTVPKVSGGIQGKRGKNQIAHTGPTLVAPGNFITTSEGVGTVRMMAHEDLAGLLIYEALGTQAASTTTHTLTLSDALPIPMTVWDLVGDDWWKFTDCWVAKLTIQAASLDIAYIEVNLRAGSYGPVSAPSYTLLDDEPRYIFGGSTTKLEADNATPTTVNNVQSMEFVVDRNFDFQYGASNTPQSYVAIGRDSSMSVNVNYTAADQGWDFLKAAALGGPSRTTPNTDLAKGSFDVKIARSPVDTSKFMQFQSAGANWEYDVDRPESSPGGGPIGFDIAGNLVNPASPGTEVTVVVVNSKSGIYS